MTKFKDCLCGERIPAEWAECPECLARAVTDSNSLHRKARVLEAKRRVGTAKAMEETLRESAGGSKALEQRRVLAQRRRGQQRRAKRVAGAMKEWMSEAK